MCMLSTAQRAPHLDGHDLYGDQGCKGLGMHVVLRAVGVDGALDGEVLEQLRSGWGRGCGGVGLGFSYAMHFLFAFNRGGGKATGRKGARCCAAGPAGSTQQAQAAALSEARQRGGRGRRRSRHAHRAGPAQHGTGQRAAQRSVRRSLTSRMMRSRNFSRNCCPMHCSSSTNGTCRSGRGERAGEVRLRPCRSGARAVWDGASGARGSMPQGASRTCAAKQGIREPAGQAGIQSASNAHIPAGPPALAGTPSARAAANATLGRLPVPAHLPHPTPTCHCKACSTGLPYPAAAAPRQPAPHTRLAPTAERSSAGRLRLRAMLLHTCTWCSAQGRGSRAREGRGQRAPACRTTLWARRSGRPGALCQFSLSPPLPAHRPGA